MEHGSKNTYASPVTPPPLLIINADDFGENEPITAGIAACLEKGAITSATILANMPATGEAMAWAAARAGNPRMSFGVHLNLCEGRPLTQAPSLVGDDGLFRRKRAQGLRAFMRRLNMADVERELRAQILRVRDAGVDITHLDSHKHLHQLPGVGAVVAGLAVELGIPRVRCTLEDDAWRPGLSLVANLSRCTRRRLAVAFAQAADARGLRRPARAFDLAQLMALNDAAARLDLIRRGGPVIEMFCHPGDARADAVKPSSARRHAEYQFLMSADFRPMIERAGVRLGSFRDL